MLRSRETSASRGVIETMMMVWLSYLHTLRVIALLLDTLVPVFERQRRRHPPIQRADLDRPACISFSARVASVTGTPRPSHVLFVPLHLM